jgi:glycosyltransferase involved in cell wall biosynthesis
MNKFLINATNLHFGGGVQVATSFIEELLLIKKKKILKNISIFLSKEVNKSFVSTKKKNKTFLELKIKNTYGFSLIFKKLNRCFDFYNTVFTIYGPLYCWGKSFKSIVGFAQPWIIYPENECYKLLSLIEKIKTRLKYKIQGLFFKRADVIIVELESVKKKLISVLGIEPNRIHVIHSCVSSVYFNKSKWQSLNIPTFKGYLRIGYLGANYFHKNTEIFYEISKKLKNLYGIKAVFYVTFTEQEWANCTSKLKTVCINLGQLKPAQCPSFYKAMDGMILPSLLECFSIMPLETMVMKKPLFVSDRIFNREICGSHAHYFNPLSPVSAAKIISTVFNENGPKLKELRLARKHAIKFGNAKQRAKKYLELLTENKKI